MKKRKREDTTPSKNNGTIASLFKALHKQQQTQPPKAHKAVTVVQSSLTLCAIPRLHDQTKELKLPQHSCEYKVSTLPFLRDQTSVQLSAHTAHLDTIVAFATAPACDALLSADEQAKLQRIQHLSICSRGILARLIQRRHAWLRSGSLRHYREAVQGTALCTETHDTEESDDSDQTSTDQDAQVDDSMSTTSSAATFSGFARVTVPQHRIQHCLCELLDAALLEGFSDEPTNPWCNPRSLDEAKSSEDCVGLLRVIDQCLTTPDITALIKAMGIGFGVPPTKAAQTAPTRSPATPTGNTPRSAGVGSSADCPISLDSDSDAEGSGDMGDGPQNRKNSGASGASGGQGNREGPIPPTPTTQSTMLSTRAPKSAVQFVLPAAQGTPRGSAARPRSKRGMLAWLRYCLATQRTMTGELLPLRRALMRMLRDKYSSDIAEARHRADDGTTVSPAATAMPDPTEMSGSRSFVYFIRVPASLRRLIHRLQGVFYLFSASGGLNAGLSPSIMAVASFADATALLTAPATQIDTDNTSASRVALDPATAAPGDASGDSNGGSHKPAARPDPFGVRSPITGGAAAQLRAATLPGLMDCFKKTIYPRTALPPPIAPPALPHPPLDTDHTSSLDDEPVQEQRLDSVASLAGTQCRIVQPFQSRSHLGYVLLAVRAVMQSEVCYSGVTRLDKPNAGTEGDGSGDDSDSDDDDDGNGDGDGDDGGGAASKLSGRSASARSTGKPLSRRALRDQALAATLASHGHSVHSVPVMDSLWLYRHLVRAKTAAVEYGQRQVSRLREALVVLVSVLDHVVASAEPCLAAALRHAVGWENPAADGGTVSVVQSGSQSTECTAQWPCPHCTFRNESRAIRCAVCNARAPTNVRAFEVQQRLLALASVQRASLRGSHEQDGVVEMLCAMAQYTMAGPGVDRVVAPVWYTAVVAWRLQLLFVICSVADQEGIDCDLTACAAVSAEWTCGQGKAGTIDNAIVSAIASPLLPLATGLWHYVNELEKQKLWEQAVQILRHLLRSTVTPHRRGRMWTRYIVDLTHLGLYGNAMRAAAEALADNHVIAGDRIDISRRAKRLAALICSDYPRKQSQGPASPVQPSTPSSRGDAGGDLHAVMQIVVDDDALALAECVLQLAEGQDVPACAPCTDRVATFATDTFHVLAPLCTAQAPDTTRTMYDSKSRLSQRMFPLFTVWERSQNGAKLTHRVIVRRPVNRATGERSRFFGRDELNDGIDEDVDRTSINHAGITATDVVSWLDGDTDILAAPLLSDGSVRINLTAALTALLGLGCSVDARNSDRTRIPGVEALLCQVQRQGQVPSVMRIIHRLLKRRLHAATVSGGSPGISQGSPVGARRASTPVRRLSQGSPVGARRASTPWRRLSQGYSSPRTPSQSQQAHAALGRVRSPDRQVPSHIRDVMATPVDTTRDSRTSVEQICLEYYSDGGGADEEHGETGLEAESSDTTAGSWGQNGWCGDHSEGALVRSLFTLLMWDVLFPYAPVHSADVAEGARGGYDSSAWNSRCGMYQDGPVDLGWTGSVHRRQPQAVQSSLQRIRTADADSLCSLVEATWRRHYGERARGVQWTVYSLPFLQMAAVCIGGPGLAVICDALLYNYPRMSGGLPDLWLWRVILDPSKLSDDLISIGPSALGPDEYMELLGDATLGRDQLSLQLLPGCAYESKFVEVKGPRDVLSDTQRAWIAVLLHAGLQVEVCRVSEPRGK